MANEGKDDYLPDPKKEEMFEELSRRYEKEKQNREKHIVELELTPELEQTGIVERFAFYAETNAIHVLLSHHYTRKTIVFSLYKKNWNKTHNIFEKLLKQKGISKEHILQLSEVLDNNYNTILSLDSSLNADLDSSDKIHHQQQQKETSIIVAAEALLAENDEQEQQEQQVITDPSKDLDPYIPDRDYVENVIKTAKKTVKQEDVLVRQIVYTGLSAYTNDPINLGIIAPTSEGKTYPVIECMNLFPKDDKWLIGKMSTKMLVRQKGVLVDENNEPLKPKIRDIKYQIKLAEQDGDTEHAQDLKDQLAVLYERCRTLIELKGKILVFLEPPEHELWNLLKPILSHDSDEIEFPFVDKTERGFDAKRVVVKGWPACIFCSAKDESNWSVWPEIVSRSLITSPTMNPVKYRESNLLIAQRKGLPSLIQQQIILSDNESKIAELCILYLKQQITTILENIVIRYISNAHKHNNNPVWLPYFEILAEALPSDKGSDNRIAKRIFSLIQIIAFTKSHLRNKLVLGPDTLTIASLEDLGQVLYITQNLSGMPVHKLDFFKNWIISPFRAKSEPDSETDSRGNVTKEKIIGLTTREICAYYKKQTGKAIGSDSLKKIYLYELLNNGYIDEQDSVLDKRQKVYYPIIDVDDFNNSNNNIYMINKKNTELQESRPFL